MIGESYYAWTQWMAAAHGSRRTWPASSPSTAAPTCTATWPTTAASSPAASRPAGTSPRSAATTGWAAWARTPTRATGTWPGTSCNHQTVRRLLEGAQPRLQEHQVPGVQHRHPAQGGHPPARQPARLRRGRDAQEAHALPRRLRGRRGGHLRVRGDAQLAAALVRPLAQGQRHRHHGRAGAQHLRARAGALPPRGRLAAGPDAVHPALSFRGKIWSCCLSQRRRPLLGSARRPPRLRSPTPIPIPTGPASPAWARR